MGQGNFTVQTDPESGEHGIVIELGETEAKDVNAAEGCELDIDYQSAVTAQGDISAQSTNTRKYKGRKITQQRIDQAKEDAGQAAEESTTSIPSSGTSGEFNAQWAWTYRTYTHYMQTFDPAFYKVNSTWNQLTWWHNGYDTDYYYPLSDARDGGCWGSHNRLSEWNISSCRFNGGMWYGYSSSRSWIGSELSAKYYDYYFGDNNLSTRAYHTSRVWGYSLGYAGNRPTWSIYGEFATALRVSSFGQYPY